MLVKRSEVWTAALFYGQAKPELKDLEGLSKSLKLDLEVSDINIYHESKKTHDRSLMIINSLDILLDLLVL